MRKATQLSACLLAFAELMVSGGCDRPQPTAPTQAGPTIEGEWLVDFGTQEGVLSLWDGNVYAFCYGNAQVGTYSLRDSMLTMIVRFDPTSDDLDLSGRVVPGSDRGFSVRRRTRTELSFRPYTGDCSEVH